MATMAASNQQQYYAAASVAHQSHYHSATENSSAAMQAAAAAAAAAAANSQASGWPGGAHSHPHHQQAAYQAAFHHQQTHYRHQHHQHHQDHLNHYAQPVEQLYQSQAAVAAAAAAAAAMVQQQQQQAAPDAQLQAELQPANEHQASTPLSTHQAYTPNASGGATNLQQAQEATKSTKGASKLRRDLINTEISQLRDLLPLPASTRQRLSQLQLMALVLVYVRKSNYFCNAFRNFGITREPSLAIPTSGFSKALNGFIMMLTQKGKLLYISDNAAEYLGHSMEDLLSHGDEVYDIIEEQDKKTVRTELLSSECDELASPRSRSSPLASPKSLHTNPFGQTGGEQRQLVSGETRIALCRMNVSRNARRQMRFGDQKIVLIEGHFFGHLPLSSRDEPVFIATCTPVAMPETRECVVQGSTNVFTSIHSMDMKFLYIDAIGEHHLACTRQQIHSTSWYNLIDSEYLHEAQTKHKRITLNDQERSTIALLKMAPFGDPSRSIWLHSVMQVKEASEHSGQPVVVCTNQVLSEREAQVMRANSWLYQFYSLHSKVDCNYAPGSPLHALPDQDHHQTGGPNTGACGSTTPNSTCASDTHEAPLADQSEEAAACESAAGVEVAPTTKLISTSNQSAATKASRSEAVDKVAASPIIKAEFGARDAGPAERRYSRHQQHAPTKLKAAKVSPKQTLSPTVSSVSSASPVSQPTNVSLFQHRAGAYSSLAAADYQQQYAQQQQTGQRLAWNSSSSVGSSSSASSISSDSSATTGSAPTPGATAQSAMVASLYAASIDPLSQQATFEAHQHHNHQHHASHQSSQLAMAYSSHAAASYASHMMHTNSQASPPATHSQHSHHRYHPYAHHHHPQHNSQQQLAAAAAGQHAAHHYAGTQAHQQPAHPQQSQHQQSPQHVAALYAANPTHSHHHHAAALNSAFSHHHHHHHQHHNHQHQSHQHQHSHSQVPHATSTAQAHFHAHHPMAHQSQVAAGNVHAMAAVAAATGQAEMVHHHQTSAYHSAAAVEAAAAAAAAAAAHQNNVSFHYNKLAAAVNASA